MKLVRHMSTATKIRALRDGTTEVEVYNTKTRLIHDEDGTVTLRSGRQQRTVEMTEQELEEFLAHLANGNFKAALKLFAEHCGTAGLELD